MGLHALLVAAVGSLLAAGDSKEDAVKKEMTKLQGTWKFVSMEIDGKKKPEVDFKKQTVVFKDDQWTVWEGDKILATVTFKLDPTKDPKTVDLRDAKNKRLVRGIYSLKGDTLTVCDRGSENGDRPTTFATKPDSGFVLFVLQRTKPSNPNGTDCYGDSLPDGAVARMGTVRFRQGAPVVSLAFSQGGAALVSRGSFDRTIHLWATATGRELRRFVGGASISVALSPDGKMLATGLVDGTVQRWDVATGQRLPPLPGKHTEGVLCLAFSQDGHILASGGQDKTILLHEAATGKERHRLSGHQGLVLALAFSPDGTRLASGASSEPMIRLWDVASGKEVGQLMGEQAGVRCLTFSPDGKTLAAANFQRDSKFRLWDVACGHAGKEVRQFDGHPPGSLIHAIAFAPDGKTLASAAPGDGVRFWDAATGKQLPPLPGTQSGGATAVAFSPDRKTLAAGLDRAVRLWNMTTGKEITSADTGHQLALTTVAFSPDGKHLATGSDDRTVRLWEAASGKELRGFRGHHDGILTVSFTKGGKALFSAGRDRTIRLWDVDTGRQLRQLDTFVTSIAFAPDGKTLAAAGSDWTIRLCAAATGKELRQFTGQQPRCVAYAPDGRYLASASHDKAVRIWELATGKELRRFDNQPYIQAIAFSADGRALASGGYENTVQLCEVASGKERRRFEVVRGIKAVALSPDGRVLAAGGWFQPVHLWDLATGKAIGQLDAHQGAVKSLAFAPDGRTLAAGSDDTTALIWDIAGLLKAAPQASELAPEPLQRLWTDLADTDAARAYQALWALAHAHKQSVPYLQRRLHERLPPASAADARRIARLIADLDDDIFAVRDQATRELEQFGESAEPALRNALHKGLHGEPSPEVHRRLQQLLGRFDKTSPSPERLQALRAIEVLELVATPEARQALATLAKATPGAWLTREAHASLQRLAKRCPPSS